MAGLDEILACEPDQVILATGAEMVAPVWLPAKALEGGWVPDLRAAIAELLRHAGRQPGTAVIYDMAVSYTHLTLPTLYSV